MPNVRTECLLGGESLEKQKKMLKGPGAPHIIVGTPGRVLHLAKDKSLNLDNLKIFILDECDKVLENVGKFPPNYSTSHNDLMSYPTLYETFCPQFSV